MKSFYKKIFALENISGYKVLTLFGKKIKLRNNFGHVKFPKNAENYVYNGTTPNKIKRLAIVASFNSKGKIEDYVVYYLQELKKVCDGIIFIADNPVIESEVEKIKEYVIYAEFKRHNRYDFGSYNRGYEYALNSGILSDIDELVLCNDSNFGPIYPLEEVFGKMAGKDCDFWGLLSNTDYKYHIQSYFMAFRSKVIKSNKVHEFLSKIKKEKSFRDVVVNYECEFTHYLHDNGFKSETFVPLYIDEETENKLIINGNRNKTLLPITLIEKFHFPFVKIKSFTQFYKDVACCDSPVEILECIKPINPKVYNLIEKYLDEHHIKYDAPLSSAYELIDQNDIISFNLFDTLVFYPYMKMADLYLHMEKLYGMPGFVKERILASEKIVEKFPDKLYTIDDLYNLMPKKYRIMKEKELSFREKVICRNDKIYDLYKYALSKNKTVVIMLDTSFPKSMIMQILKEKEISDYSGLYISGDYNKTKISGELYKQLMKDYDIQASEQGVLSKSVLHIGIYNTADIKIPKSLSFSTYKVPKYKDTYKKSGNSKKYQVAYKTEPSVQNSIINFLVVKHLLNGEIVNYRHEAGYGLCGPILLCFLQRLTKSPVCMNLDDALLQKAFVKIKKELPKMMAYLNKDKEFKQSQVSELIKYVSNLESDEDNIMANIQSGAISFVKDFYAVYKDFAPEFDLKLALNQFLYWGKYTSRYDEAVISETVKK
jgi:rhamnosyltransferase